MSPRARLPGNVSARTQIPRAHAPSNRAPLSRLRLSSLCADSRLSVYAQYASADLGRSFPFPVPPPNVRCRKVPRRHAVSLDQLAFPARSLNVRIVESKHRARRDAEGSALLEWMCRTDRGRAIVAAAAAVAPPDLATTRSLRRACRLPPSDFSFCAPATGTGRSPRETGSRCGNGRFLAPVDGMPANAGLLPEGRTRRLMPVDAGRTSSATLTRRAARAEEGAYVPLRRTGGNPPAALPF